VVVKDEPVFRALFSVFGPEGDFFLEVGVLGFFCGVVGEL